MKRTHALLAVLAAVALFGLPNLLFPFGRDQGNYAYAAWVWLDGAALYRDVFVFKPPATVFVHALAITLFGPSMTAIRVLDLAWTAAIALTTASVARRMGGDRTVAAVAGILYALVYDQQTYWSTAQTDGWMNLPMLLALRLALDDEERLPLLETFAVGVLVGVAMVFKYTAAVALLPVGVAMAARLWRQRRSGDERPVVATVLRRAAVLAVGVALPLAALAGWLLGTGAWAAFVDCQVGLVTTYVSATRHYGPVQGVEKVISQLLTNEGMVTGGWAAAVGFGWMTVQAVRGRAPEQVIRLALVGSLFVAGVVSCVSQGKLFVYHYLPILPGLAIAGAVGIVDVGRWALDRRPLLRLPSAVRLLAWAALAVALFAGTRTPGRYQTLSNVLASPGGVEGHWHRSSAYKTTDFSLRDNLELADLLRKTTSADDRVFLWGFEPLVNYVAQRRTVSRFLYNYPFAVSWGNAAYENELLDALRAEPPAVFVVSSHDATPGVTGNPDDSAALFARFTELRAFVLANYGTPTTLRRFDVYRRKDLPPAP